MLHGVRSRGSWSGSLDIGEGFSIKWQIFTLACNLSDTKQGRAQATWRRHMGDGCTPLRVVPHNVLGAVHLVRPHSVQPLGVLCPVCPAHFTRMCGELAVPLAQQVHQSHIWQTLGPQRLCCPLCLSVPLFFTLGIFVMFEDCQNTISQE